MELTRGMFVLQFYSANVFTFHLFGSQAKVQNVGSCVTSARDEGIRS